MNGDTHISSLVIQTRPERLEEVAGAIQLRGAEIPASDPSGKLIVVLETESEIKITNFLNEVAVMSGVISANLVFHHIDEQVGGPGTNASAPFSGGDR